MIGTLSSFPIPSRYLHHNSTHTLVKRTCMGQHVNTSKLQLIKEGFWIDALKRGKDSKRNMEERSFIYFGPKIFIIHSDISFMFTGAKALKNMSYACISKKPTFCLLVCMLCELSLSSTKSRQHQIV
ncbi:hypothetical protein GQX74_001428 [Glossina fuscipes]|nr:hypothetical protein GQX74_001428 [Glossina fuscipes]